MSTTTSDDTENLKVKIKAVMTKHRILSVEFYNLKAATSKTPGTDWIEFDKNVDMASGELKEAIALLGQQKVSEKSPVAPSKEDANKEVFENYAKLYAAIINPLIADNNLKPDIGPTNYEELILTANFLEMYPESDKSGTSINNFILAIKNYSLNSNAMKIKMFTDDFPNNLNHQLLKAVLDALEPTGIKTLLLATGTSYDTLDNLINAITAMFTISSENSLQAKIKELYMKATVASASGGSSSTLSTSKKNRKSHKYYHPGIGKTRKHHRCNHNKNSFVH